MKRILGLISTLLLIGSQAGFSQESDDMYFFKTDRVRPEKAALGIPSTSSTPDFSKNEGGESIVQDKFLNPDFNSSNALSNTATTTYVQEDQLLTSSDQTWNNINRPNNSFNSPYGNSWNRPSFNMGTGFGPWGSMTNIGLSFGMGSMWGNSFGMNSGFGSPWGYGYNGFNDPYWGGGFNSWNRWCRPGFGGGFYSPTVVFVDNRPSREFTTFRNTTGNRSRNVTTVRTANMQERVSQLASRNDRNYFTRSQNSNNVDRSQTNRSFMGRDVNRSNSSFQNRNQQNSRSNSFFSTPSNSGRSSSRSSFSSGRSSGTRSSGTRSSSRRGN